MATIGDSAPGKSLFFRAINQGGHHSGRKGQGDFFDCNVIHGSASNISPHPRSMYLWFITLSPTSLLNPIAVWHQGQSTSLHADLYLQ